MKKIINHPRFGEVAVSRTRRATRISVSVRPPGVVRLSIPASCSLKAGIDFLGEKEAWVEATLAKLAAKYPVKIIAPPYRTRHRELVFAPADTNKISGRVTRDRIVVSYPSSMSHTSQQVQSLARKCIVEALRDEAKELLPPMVAEIARRHGFRYGKVSVRATATRWGSCSSCDDISLSLFLIRLPEHLIEYIIVHELCHTRHRDHSARFHELADALLGGREKELRRELKAWPTDVI